MDGTQLEFGRLSIAEVSRETLSALNPHKSTGHDNIPSRILKTASKTLARSLTNLYNNCIKQSYWPKEWKRGEWAPKFKKDSHLNVNNYRPVTVLNAVDKVFEQLISKQVTEFIEPYLSR